MAKQTASLGKQERLMSPADSRRQALDKIRAEVRKHIPADVSLVDELIRERRQEAARDEAEAASPVTVRSVLPARPVRAERC